MNATTALAITIIDLKVTLMMLISKYEAENSISKWQLKDAKDQILKAEEKLNEWAKSTGEKN